jgi:hypothetical protein
MKPYLDRQSGKIGLEVKVSAPTSTACEGDTFRDQPVANVIDELL